MRVPWSGRRRPAGRRAPSPWSSRSRPVTPPRRRRRRAERALQHALCGRSARAGSRWSEAVGTQRLQQPSTPRHRGRHLLRRVRRGPNARDPHPDTPLTGASTQKLLAPRPARRSSAPTRRSTPGGRVGTARPTARSTRSGWSAGRPGAERPTTTCRSSIAAEPQGRRRHQPRVVGRRHRGQGGSARSRRRPRRRFPVRHSSGTLPSWRTAIARPARSAR